MLPEVVSWRRAWVWVLFLAVLASGGVLLTRATGFTATDASVPRATRWFVDELSGNAVLVDGFAGRLLARVDTESDGERIEVAQGSGNALLVDRTAGTTRLIDGAALRLGPAQAASLVAAPGAILDVGRPGLVAVDPNESEAMLLGADGVAVPFEAEGVGRDALVAPDGAIWSAASGELRRVTSTGTTELIDGIEDPTLSLVGSRALVFDRTRGKVTLSDGSWWVAPDDFPAFDVVVQEPGPSADCGWIAAGDQLLCIDETGAARSVEIEGLNATASDRLVVAGDVAALIRRNPAEVVRLDLRHASVLDNVSVDLPPGSSLDVRAGVDLVWLEDRSGQLVWALHPWGINVVSKNDLSAPLLAETGEVIAAGVGGSGAAPAGSDDSSFDIDPFEPDNNGIDDPPVAVDDFVSARSGSAVPVSVTANDYDPDGEAVVLMSVGDPARGTVEIASGSAVVYQPDATFSTGVDRFEYTIVDAAGTEASATVTVELLATDAPNRAPVGAADVAETGPGRPVIVDVLLNDIDPERDAILIGDYTQPDAGGSVVQVPAPSELPGLQFTPDPSFSGTAEFTYRPLDSLGASGDPVRVLVEVARAGDENRAPLTKPDAVRVRREIETKVPVLANDRDPDGDPMMLQLGDQLPPGIEARVAGAEIVIVARAGAAPLSSLEYRVVDDGGLEAYGNVLIAVVADEEPNRPPTATADVETAVAGQSVLLDVLSNDSDPDGDPIVLIGATPGTNSSFAGQVIVQNNHIEYIAANVEGDENFIDRFTYEISDGQGNTAIGSVTVTVNPEAVAQPPNAVDDNANTTVDQSIDIVVLANDTDPSGGRPSLTGTPSCPSGGTASRTADDRIRYTPPSGQMGVFTCHYEVVSALGFTDTATIRITVDPAPIVNQPPVVVDDSATVRVGEQVRVDVLANDSDPEGSPLRLQLSQQPVSGSATVVGSEIVFDAPDLPMAVTLSYRVFDDDGGSTTGRLTIRVVEPEPLPPRAIDDRRSVVAESGPVIIDVLANDADPDGSPDHLTISSVQIASGFGRATHDGQFVTITPDGRVGSVVAVYTILDADGLAASAQIVLTITEPPNRPPSAQDTQLTVDNGQSRSINLGALVIDPDGDDLTYAIENRPLSSLGSAQIVGNELQFSASPGASGSGTLTYRVSDGELIDTATVSINVRPCGVALPHAPEVYYQTGYQTPINIRLSDHVTNGEVVYTSGPWTGPDGVYTPPAGENGVVVFTYTVRNSCGLEDIGTVTVDVNQAPLPNPTRVEIGRSEVASIAVSELGSDAEPLTISSLDGRPEWVTIAEGGASLRLNPAGRSTGATFTVTLSDPGGLTTSVPVEVVLINRAPVAQPDRHTTRVEGPSDAVYVVDVLANDSDPDGVALSSIDGVPSQIDFDSMGSANLSVVSVDGRDHVRVEVISRGVGSASFSYSAIDDLGQSSQPTEVELIVNRTNLPPVVNSASVTVMQGKSSTVTVAASDAEGDALTVRVGTHATSLFAAADGLNLAVTAPLNVDPGTYSIPFTVSDGANAPVSANVSVTVTPLAPPSAGDVDVTIVKGGTSVVDLPVNSPLLSLLEISSVDAPQELTVEMLPESRDLRVTVNASAAVGETYAVRYTVVDVLLQVATGEVRVTVGAPPTTTTVPPSSTTTTVPPSSTTTTTVPGSSTTTTAPPSTSTSTTSTSTTTSTTSTSTTSSTTTLPAPTSTVPDDQ